MAKGPSSSLDPYLLPSQQDVRFVSVVTAGDSLPNDGVFGGTPDGIGAYDNGNGTLTVLVNHEFGATAGLVRDHGGTGAYIDRIVIDKSTLGVVSADDAIQKVQLWDDAGDQYVTSTNATFTRFCSGDLAQPTAFFDSETGQGTQARIYLTGEEAGVEGRATATILTGPNAGTLYELPFLGNMSYENLVANPYEQDKTIVAMTDDATGGQVYIHIGEKTASGNELQQAGLVGGEVYGIKVAGVLDETNASAVNGTFTLARIGDSVAGGVSNMTGAQIETESDADGVTGFLRPEDFAWDPENPNTAYFATTNAFDAISRIYQLTFNDITHPELGGTIKAVVESDDYGAHMFDNLTVDNGKVVVQEDPGNQAYVARVWEYDIATGSFTEAATFDPAQFTPGQPGAITQDEESSGIIDVTHLLGDGDTRAYLLDAQVHLATSDPATVERGQLLVMYDDDPALGTNKADDLRGNSNDQTIGGQNGDDVVWAYGGNDIVSGGNGIDRLHGGSGNDAINGDNGDDALFGDLGDDILTGGRGGDSFIFNNSIGSGADAITDFAAADRLLTIIQLNAVNGVVDFGSDDDLDLYDGGFVMINGGTVDHLTALGTVQLDGTTYYSYGLHG